MSLILMEQLKTQKEDLSPTEMVELAYSYSAAQPFADADIAADDLLDLFTEHELEETEEIEALDAPEATLDVDEADRREPEEGSDLANALRLYLREIGRVPRLTAQEEIRLARLVQQGQLEQQRALQSNRPANDIIMHQAQEAQRRLIEANLRLVVSIAKKYQTSGLALLDLIQEGNQGLMLVNGCVILRPDNFDPLLNNFRPVKTI